MADTSIVTLMAFMGQTVIDGLATAELIAPGPRATPIVYVGPEPDDCCPGEGCPPNVVVFWKNMGAPSGRPSSDCLELDAITIGVRMLMCWPSPPNGMVGDAAEAHRLFDKAGSLNARAAWIGQQSLRNALGICAPGGGRPAQRKLISDTLGISNVTMGQTVPRLPRGGCAGVDWTVNVTPHGTDLASWLDPASAEA